jgi:hypothetical protein
MQYEIPHTCGHTQLHFFFRDPHRNRRMFDRFSRQPCANCKRRMREDQRNDPKLLSNDLWHDDIDDWVVDSQHTGERRRE